MPAGAGFIRGYGPNPKLTGIVDHGGLILQFLRVEDRFPNNPSSGAMPAEAVSVAPFFPVIVRDFGASLALGLYGASNHVINPI